MIETRTELLKGKSTVIKNKQYLSTKDYVDPFFSRLDPLKPMYIIQVKKADQLSITNNDPDIVYNRVHIQAILPDSYYNENKKNKVVGFIYGLDVKNPVAKFYIADIDFDGNLYAFNLEALRVQEIEDSTALNYSPIKELLEYTDVNSTMVKQIESTDYDTRDNMIHRMGEWVNYALNGSYSNEGGKVKLATTIPVDAYKSLILDKDSDHYILETNSIKYSNVYKSFASIIKNDKDIMNNFEKTILLSRMLGL